MSLNVRVMTGAIVESAGFVGIGVGQKSFIARLEYDSDFLGEG